MSDPDTAGLVSVEWTVQRDQGMVIMSVIDEDPEGDVVVHVMEPLMAATLAAALFDKAEQEGDDVDES